MKKIKGVKGLVAGMVVMSLMLTGSAFATDRVTAISNEVSNVDEAKVMTNLANKSFDKLISDINALGDSVDMSDLIFHADALLKKATEIPQDQIINEILDEANSNNVRVILTQINRHLGNSESNEKLVTLLEQNDVDFEIKRNILLNIYQSSPDDIAVYEKVALGEDERLAFHAIKILNETAPEKAIEISDTIMQNFKGTVTDKVKASIKVKASQLRNSSTANERQNFISFCDSILTADGRMEEVVTDTVIFALSDVMSEESISYIITSDKIDNTAKVFCIDQNYSVLEEMVTKNVTPEKIEIVLEAMSIYPIVEMAEHLQTVSSPQLQLRSAESVELTKEIQATLDKISENGLNVTRKY